LRKKKRTAKQGRQSHHRTEDKENEMDEYFACRTESCKLKIYKTKK
jgi:hypothetical protein